MEVNVCLPLLAPVDATLERQACTSAMLDVIDLRALGSDGVLVETDNEDVPELPWLGNARRCSGSG